MPFEPVHEDRRDSGGLRAVYVRLDLVPYVNGLRGADTGLWQARREKWQDEVFRLRRAPDVIAKSMWPVSPMESANALPVESTFEISPVSKPELLIRPMEGTTSSNKASLYLWDRTLFQTAAAVSKSTECPAPSSTNCSNFAKNWTCSAVLMFLTGAVAFWRDIS